MRPFHVLLSLLSRCVARTRARLLRASSAACASAALPLPLAALAGALAAPAVRASDVVVPAGFNLETLSLGGSLAGILPDGTVLLGTGSFGADALSVRHPDGTVTPFAAGFGSIAGIAQSPVTGDIVVGDSLFTPALRVLRDLDADGDALDPGENLPHPAALPVLSNGAAPLPFSLAFRPGTDELFVSGSTPFGVQPTLGVVVAVAGSSATVWADGLGLAAGMVWLDRTLYVADLELTFIGRVLALTDGSSDGDALDPGEAVTFAAGLSGASDLVRAQDGSFYLSGTFDVADFSATVARLLPDGDGDGVTDGVDETWADGFAFTANLTLQEGAAGLLPGAGGDGALVVQDFGAEVLDRSVRSAPLATLALTGTVANNSSFTLHVGGAPGAMALVALSADQTGVTLGGIGDLCVGFGAPHVLLPLPAVGGSGTTQLAVLLHGVEAAVGTPFTMQAFTLQAGDVGLSNAIDAVIAP